MKKILITGKDSYIGTSFEKWLNQWPDKYQVTTIDVRDSRWEEHNFSNYDVVLHVAAIVHIKEKNKDLYNRINGDLTYKIAHKAKLSGVTYFIFMSTMGVYGMNSGVINSYTKENPKTLYSKSKFLAEKLITELKTSDFKIAILRPPLVYGFLCKGNYKILSGFAKRTPIFPKINNKRSMIFIDVLSNYLKLIIDYKVDGILLPQNSSYVNVSDLICKIRHAHSKKTKLTKILNFVKIFTFIGVFDKVFNDFYYSYDLYSKAELELLRKANITNFDDSILLSEGLL